MSAGSRRDRAHRGRDMPRASGGGSSKRGSSSRDSSRGPSNTARSGAGRSRGSTTPEAIERLLEPVVTAEGYDLEKVTVTPAGKRSVLRVVVDADDGINLDDVALVSRTVSDALDASDVMGGGPYVLEVTSPGVDRPLSEPRHWRRAAGRLVRAPLTGGGQIEGRVVSADDETVVIDVAGARRGASESGVRRLGLSELGRGRVLVEFHRDED
jgi:ribosome maturation factor RimP